MRRLPHSLWLSLALMVATACGEDAEKRYAGLDVATMETKLGVGYRVRYLAPPWEEVRDDPLVTGEGTADVRVGHDVALAPLVPNSAFVLEIERLSVVSRKDVISYPKYRFEAGLVRCGAATLASTDVCAQKLAEQDNAALAAGDTDDVGFFGRVPREGENDFGQQYFELLTRHKQTTRYRRLVYFTTGVHDLAVRVAIEANPSLAEREVTSMVDAFEVISGANGAADAGADAGGS